MDFLLIVVTTVALAFSFVVFFGAPYLPTKKRQINRAIEELGIKKGQRLLELGAGDGSVALEALKKGYKVTAIELNPLLCVVIFIRTFRYRKNITIICGNFWNTSWGEFDAVYVFLLDKYMNKLDKMLIHKQFKGRLVSFAFMIPTKKSVKEIDGLFVYKY